MEKKWKKRGKSPYFILLGGIITEFEWATIVDARLTGKMTEITEKKQTRVAEVERRGFNRKALPQSSITPKCLDDASKDTMRRSFCFQLESFTELRFGKNKAAGRSGVRIFSM